MKLKKIAVLALASILVVISVGCSKSVETGSIAGNNKKTTNSNGDTERPTGQVKLKVLALTHANTKDLNEIPMFVEHNKQSEVEIEWEQIRSGWEEKKNTLLASGDVPDIFIGGAIGDNDISSFTNLFLPLNDLIDQHAPNIKKMFDEMPDTEKISTFSDGNIYGLPAVRPHRPNSFSTLMINKTWLDTLGLEVPKTFDEFYTVLKAFKEQDPNGNGQADEVPFDFRGDRGIFSILGMTGAYGNYVHDFSGKLMAVKEGTAVFIPQTEDYKSYIKYLSKLYRDGLINQEVFTQDFSQYIAKSQNPGTPLVGAAIGWSLDSVMGVEHMDEYVAIEPLAAEEGIKPLWPANTARVKFEFNRVQITTANQYPEETIKWLDGFYGEEMSAQAYYGSLGTCMEKKDDQYVVLPPADEKTTPDTWMWQNSLVDNGMMYCSPELEDRITPPDARIKRLEIDEIYKPYYPKDVDVYPIVKFTKEELDELAVIETDIFKMVDIKLAEWITKGNVDEEWDDFQKQLKKMGVDTMLEIYQQGYNTYFNK